MTAPSTDLPGAPMATSPSVVDAPVMRRWCAP